MSGLVKKLQERPEGYRRGLSFIISFSVTILIVMVWVSSFNTRVGDSIYAKDNKEKENITTSASPFKTFTDDISRVKKNITEGFNSLLSSVNVVEYKASDTPE